MGRSWLVSRWVFLRLLGLIYLAAFASLLVQIDGLIGSHGILPTGEFLDAVREQLGTRRLIAVPSLCWLNPGDDFLHGLCAIGCVASMLLIFNIAPAPMLGVLYLAFLSVQAVGQDFLAFQWDILLLESGFLAIWLAPLGVRPRAGAEPPRVIRWLLGWLLFRLMFASGAVKLLSGDPSWQDGTALTVHYQTQPIPNAVAWYAHQLPRWFHRLSCQAMFAIELGAPWLMLLPRPGRLAGAGLLAFLQVLIMATGNYAYFNWLALALILLLLDDQAWPGTIRRRLRSDPGGAEWPAMVTWTVGGLLLAGSLVIVTAQLQLPIRWPRPVVAVHQTLASLRLVNGYGLFAVMTTTRPEIIVEGSDDGATWTPYEFRYKAGDPSRRPPFVAPHQPRLDWQMWFAALGPSRQSPWFLRFCVKLLEGEPEVLGLLAANPFPNDPPRYLRAVVWDYRFTDPAERRAGGSWWRRSNPRIFLPAISLNLHGMKRRNVTA